MKISYKTKSLIYKSTGIALVGENGGMNGCKVRDKQDVGGNTINVKYT